MSDQSLAPPSSFSQRLREIRTGFERPFWVANISELFERLSYYAAFASLARYLHESLNFGVERATSLAGLFGGLVWFLAIFGGVVADRLGFRRSLSLAYLILSCSYFLLGSIGAPWLAPVRHALPLSVLVTIVLMLPALGIALVKPCVVGTTARASKENVRSIGYSIYYTIVNIGGTAGPFVASWVHQRASVENVFRVAALSVFAMFFA
ncbi:MAG TPA: MFS transporter, partial [Candidatus Kapabacteria bacterium]|nr:MFS transporter [Candidatus Kapabacteria bacterium]